LHKTSPQEHFKLLSHEHTANPYDNSNKIYPDQRRPQANQLSKCRRDANTNTPKFSLRIWLIFASEAKRKQGNKTTKTVVQNSNCLLILNNGALLTDIDTIQELSDIFVLHMAFLLHQQPNTIYK
jgi:hypothetical protein